LSIRCERFRAEHLEALQRLAQRAFPERPNTPEFLRWRYLDLPEQFGELAFEGADCVAMCWGFVRPYLLGSRKARVIEIQDWYCLPEHRGQGTGVALLRRAMEGDDPTLTFGGSEHTVAIVAKLHWTHLGDAHHFALPLSARVLPPRRRLGSLGRSLDAAVQWWFKPASRSPKGGEVVWGPLGSDPPHPDPSGDPAAAPLISSQMARWLAAGETFCGRYFVHRFLVDGKERGWSLARIVDTERQRIGVILRAHMWEPAPDVEEWILAELLRWFAGQGVDAVRLTVASAEPAAAVRRLRFFYRGSSPIHSYQQGKTVSFPRVAVGYDVSDKLLLPLAEGARR